MFMETDALLGLYVNLVKNQVSIKASSKLDCLRYYLGNIKALFVDQRHMLPYRFLPLMLHRQGIVTKTSHVVNTAMILTTNRFVE